MGLATIVEVEGHLVVGGGILSITCIDENFNARTHVYLKICLGAAVGVGGTVGYVGNADGKSCSNPPPYLLGGEFGGVLLAGADVGVSVATDKSGASISLSLPVGSVPTKYGVEVKSTACWYILLY